MSAAPSRGKDERGDADRPPTLSVLGAPIATLDYDGVVEFAIGRARRGEAALISALANHGIMEALDSPPLLGAFQQFDALTPDGQGVFWALKLLGESRLAERVCGPELMSRVCRRAAKEGLPIFLYGSTEETLAALSRNLGERFPRLRVAGRRASRFRPATRVEHAADAREIVESGARIVLVGLGCPRQEWWIWQHRADIALPKLGLGAAFDFHAGNLERPPKLVGDLGLEWLYRLIQEPRRLWKRNFYYSPRFVLLVLERLLAQSRLAPENRLKLGDDVFFG